MLSLHTTDLEFEDWSSAVKGGLTRRARCMMQCFNRLHHARRGLALFLLLQCSWYSFVMSICNGPYFYVNGLLNDWAASSPQCFLLMEQITFGVFGKCSCLKEMFLLGLFITTNNNILEKSFHSKHSKRWCRWGDAEVQEEHWTRCEAMTHSGNRLDDVSHYARESSECVCVHVCVSAPGVPAFLPKQHALCRQNSLTR